MPMKKKQQTEDASSSSSSNGVSTEETTRTRRRSEARRYTRKKEDKVIRMLEEIKEEICKQSNETRKKLKKLAESQNELRMQLELRINGSSGDDSAAPRSETTQVPQPPKYRLEFTCEVNDIIKKKQIIETKKPEKMISVALYDDHNQIVATGPYAFARVMLVVIDGEFNQHGNQYNWSRKDFEGKIIKRSRQGNSATGDENQSIVSNGIFQLDGGIRNHSAATILNNSGNKRVRLGVMVVSPTEERVLEGLSNLFFVRDGTDKSKRQRFNPTAATLQFLGNTVTEASQQQASIPQHQFSHLGSSMAPAKYLPAGDEQLLLSNGNFMDPNLTPQNYSMGNDRFLVPTIGEGTQFNMDQIALPVQLVWDRPTVGPIKSGWNLLDQLVPLYTCQPKFNNCGLPIMRLMSEHFGSLTIIPKEVMQTRQKRGVLIEPLEPDDSDEEPPLKRKLHSKYRLRFVNKVCETYYTWERIKAYDGNLLKVALFDENNTRITSGPLSSASVEVVVLHGDFIVDGEDYWSSEEFNRCVVCQLPGKEASVLGGDSTLVLADGEACLDDAFFKIASFWARTGKFKMGVMLASTRDERIQEGISEPFRVQDHGLEVLHGKDAPTFKGLPPGFRFHPTDEELIVHYLCQRAAGKPFPAPIMAEVDIYKFDPWELPAKAVFGKHEWYFFSPLDRKYANDICPNRAAGSGYWKDTSNNTCTPRVIHSNADGMMIGLKRTLVFYKGRPPMGIKTCWIMHEYLHDKLDE